MKIWIKFIFGIVLGILLAFILPLIDDVINVVNFFTDLFINIGKYIVLPLVFFSIIIGTYELKREKKLLKVYIRLVIFMICGTALLTIIGAISGLLIPTGGILPMNIESPFVIPDIGKIILTIFPENLFQVFIVNGGILFPLVIFAFLVGVSLEHEKQYARPIIQLSDSASRLFYHINSLVIEVFWIGLIAITTSRILQLRNIQEGAAYINLLIVLGIDVIIIVFAIYPLIIYLLDKKTNPYKWLFATIGPALVALITGDNNLSIGMLIKHGKENMNVSRKIGSTVYPLTAIFGRVGTALIVSASIVFLRTSILITEISFLEFFWILGGTFLISFISAFIGKDFPASGAYIAIFILCNEYFEKLLPPNQFLSLKQIVPLLICISVFIDVITSALISFIITKQVESPEEKHAMDFI